MNDTDASGLVEDLFRRESGRLVAALARLLGPSELALAEDVVQEALIAALQAWRFGVPDDPTAWLLATAKNRAVDRIRRERRLAVLRADLGSEWTREGTLEQALSPERDAENQLALMFAVCDPTLAAETHVSLILRFLCGFSGAEIAHAFLTDVSTIDRRLHRGRTRLAELGELELPRSAEALRARQPSIEHALYLLFNEGYHGSDAERPLQPALVADAVRLAELLLGADAIERSTAHALAALFHFGAARLPGRLDDEGVVLPLAEQERSRWDRTHFDRGIVHLGESAGGTELTRYHLEAGIAFEHTRARSVETTDWPKIVEYYALLAARTPSPVVALNHAVALAEVRGLDAGRAALTALETDPKLTEYSFYWAARADVERRAGNVAVARAHYERAMALARSAGERRSYERRIASVASTPKAAGERSRSEPRGQGPR